MLFAELLGENNGIDKTSTASSSMGYKASTYQNVGSPFGKIFGESPHANSTCAGLNPAGAYGSKFLGSFPIVAPAATHTVTVAFLAQ